MKYEQVYLRVYASVSDARLDAWYLAFYNGREVSPILGRQTPDKAYLNALQARRSIRAEKSASIIWLTLSYKDMEYIMKVTYLIVPLVSIFIAQTGIAQTIKITGLGASKCSKYIDDIIENEMSEKIYFAWAQGFMNGALVRAPAGVDDNLDLIPRSFPVTEQMVFLKNWCRSYRDADFSDASFALFKKLREQIPK